MDYGELQQAYDRLLKENAALRRELAQYQSSAVDASLPLSTMEKIRRFRSFFLPQTGQRLCRAFY